MRCPYEVIISCDKCSDNYSAAVYELNNTPNSGTRLNTYKNASPLGPDSLQLLSDSYLIASSATKPCVYLWPLNSESPTSNLKLNTPGKVSALTCTPDGSYIAVAIGETINIWQSCSGALVRSFTRHFQTINCLKFNGDGSCLASAGEDCIIFIWQLSQVANKEEAEPYTLFDHHTLPIKALHFGQVAGFGRLYSAALDRTARVYNVYSKELLLTVIFDFPLTTISTDIMENMLFDGSSTGVVVKSHLREPPRGVEHQISTGTEEEKTIFEGHTESITALSVSVDCITLLTGSSDKMIHLWDISSCQIISSIKHEAPIVSAFFAMKYDNFEAQDFAPSLGVKSWSKDVSCNDEDFTLEVSRNNEGDSWILDFDTSDDNSQNAIDEVVKTDVKKQINEELEKLRAANKYLYQFSAKKIIKNNESER